MFEFNNQEKTLREAPSSTNKGSQESIAQYGTTISGLALRTWRGFKVTEEFPAEGGEADIFIVHKDKELFVLKLYRKGLEPKEVVLSKIKELSERLSEHVVRIYEYGFDKDLGRWYELQELAPHGNLKRLLTSKRIGDKEITAILREMNEGLHALHSAGIVHRDIKPSNVLVRNPDPLDLVFTDFGVSSIIDSDVSKKLTTVKGTPIYSAPEVFTGVMGKEVDYWSLGMIIYEALTGRNPLSGLSVHTIAFKLTTEGIQIPDVDERYKLLLAGLLARNPKERWGYEQVKAWLQGKPVSAPKTGPRKVETKAEAYKFMDKYYDDLENLTLAFIESAESFDLAKRHIMKGYLRTWLEKHGDFDNLARLDDAIENSKLAEEAVVRFVYSYHEGLPLTLYGREITTDYLVDLLFSAQVGSLSPADVRIYELIQKTQLSTIMQAYELSNGSLSPQLRRLTRNAEAAAKSGKLESFVRYIAFLKSNEISFQKSTALDPFSAEFDHEAALDEQFLSLLSKLRFGDGVWFEGGKLTEETIQMELGKALKQLLDPNAGSTDLFDIAENPYVQLLMDKQIFEIVVTKAPQLSKTLELYSRALTTLLETLANLESKSKFVAHSLAREFSKLGFQPNVAIILLETVPKELMSQLERQGINVEKSNKIPPLLEKYDLVGVLVDGNPSVFSATNKLVLLTNNVDRALEEPSCYYVAVDKQNYESASFYIAYLLRALSTENFVKRVIKEAIEEKRNSAERLFHETSNLRKRLTNDAVDEIKQTVFKEISEALLNGEMSTKDIEKSSEKILERAFRELEDEVRRLHQKKSSVVAVETFLKLTGGHERLNQLNSVYNPANNVERCANNVSSALINLLLSPELQRELSIDKYVKKAKRGSCLLNVLGTIFILGGCASMFDYATSSEAGTFIVLGLIILIAGIIQQSTARQRAEGIRERSLNKILRKVGKIFDRESHILRGFIAEELERYVRKVVDGTRKLEAIVGTGDF